MLNKPLLIIKTGSTIPPLQTLGVDFEDWFQFGMGLNKTETVVVSVYKGELLPDVSSISAVVITGSPAYVTDLAPWNFAAADFLKEAFAARLPMLGICYGHQLIAWAFGGSVDFHPRGREIGTVPVMLNDAALNDDLLRGLPQQMPVNASHQQSVIDLPPGAVRLISNAFDPNHGFRLGSQTWGFQFHPEFDKQITQAYIKARQHEIDSEGLDAAELLEAVTETPESADILRRFISLVNQAT